MKAWKDMMKKENLVVLLILGLLLLVLETVYEKDAKGTQQPYVASEEYPRVTGVLIVAKGGGNPVVVGNIQAAVEALFQVEPHKIKVMKMN